MYTYNMLLSISNFYIDNIYYLYLIYLIYRYIKINLLYILYVYNLKIQIDLQDFKPKNQYPNSFP